MPNSVETAQDNDGDRGHARQRAARPDRQPAIPALAPARRADPGALEC